MANAGAVYCRISDDREGRHLGVDRQERDCRELAAARGWTIAEVYVDNDVSAYTGKPRPAYRRMLRDLKDGTRDAVITYHQDRLVRQPRELEEFFDVCDAAGITEMASVTGDLDLSNDEHRTFARILGAIAQKESNDKSRRIKRKHLELAERGEVTGGGTRPFGFEDDRKTIRQDEADLIRNAAARILAGDSLRSVCRSLNDAGVKTSAGNDWAPAVLKRLLLSARISGQRSHDGQIVATAVWPAIIPPEQTARLRAVLGGPRRVPARTPRRYLLAGLLRCHACGATMVARPRDDGERRYVCAKGPGFSGCGKTYILAPPVEQFITDAILYRLDSPDLAAALRGDLGQEPRAAQLQRELDEALAQADELANAYGATQISMREWLAARKPIEDRTQRLKKELSRYSRTEPLAQYLDKTASLRSDWTGLDLPRQQAIIKSVLDHVTVGPGRRGYNRFDPSRLTPTWRI